MKLHLGCGQRYFEGYKNIDFPLSEHSYQMKSVADEHQDISQLSYPAESIDEVRLHHVFEHFDRPTACAFVAGWNSWLKVDGLVHIEVPDFDKSAKILLGLFASKESKKVALRHLFGSHEARWAVHCEAYSEWMLTDLLSCFGFKVIKVVRHDWKGTHNLEVVAKKEIALTHESATLGAEKYLRGFLLDESEKPLLDIWLNNFHEQLVLNWAS